MSKIVIWLINQYQKFISPDTGLVRSKNPTCAFYPTCSQYSKEAYQKYGFLKASSLTAKRILRCHPWQKNHFDPLP
jgi:putative membrane protein insertion efficiency factor